MSSKDKPPESADEIANSETMVAGSADEVANSETMTADSGARAQPRQARAVGAPPPEPAVVYDDLPFVDPHCYEVLSEYGRGGLGRIMRVRDRRTGRIVAIKEMLPGTAHAAPRFKREALITANLQHPAIVPVYEVGRWQDARPFYAMKLVTGRDLHAVIKATDGPRDRLALLPHVTAVAEALAYAHSERIIHRDLKPANVLVGDYGETVVIDWGLAKNLSSSETDDLPATPYRSADDSLTQIGAIVGTPAYMPPEQARGEEVDERADVYAIGAMLYHLLAGRPPYADSKSLEELLSRVLAGPPSRIDPQTADAPQDLLAIVDMAMAHDRDERYATAQELAEDLRRFQTGKLVAAHEYSAWQLARRWITRHRAAVAVGALAVVVLASVAVVGVQRIRAERDTARAQSARADAALAEASRQLATLFAEQGRRALEEHDANRAAALLSEAYALGNDRASTRMLLARAMKGLDARASAVVLPGIDPGWTLLAYSPDGTTLAAVGEGNEAVLWDASTGSELARFPTPSGGRGVAYSPDGNRLVLVDRTGRAHLIDPARREVVWTSEVLGEYLGLLPKFAADSSAFALPVQERGQAVVIDAVAGGTIVTVPVQGIVSVALDDTGDRLLTASPRHGVRIWDTRTGALRATLGEDSDGFLDVALLSGARALALGPRGVVLWDLQRRERMNTFSVDRAVLTGMTTSSSGDTLFAWGTKGSVFAWSTERGELVGEYVGHTSQVRAGVFDDARGVLVTIGLEGVLFCWDQLTQSPVFVLGGLGDNAEAIALQPGSERVAFADRDDNVRIVDYGARRRFLTVEAPVVKVESLAFAPDGERAIIGAAAPSVAVIDTGTGALVRELAVPSPGPTYAVYSRDGRRIAAANATDAVVVYDADGQEPVATISGAASMIAIAPDGSAVAAGRADGEVRVFDATSGTQRWSKKIFDTKVSTVEYSSDGTMILVGAKDGKAAVLAAATGDPTAVPSHSGRVRGARFAPDGSFVVTVGMSEPLHIVDTTTGKLRHELGKTMLSVALSRDGTRVAGGTFEGDLGVWDTATGERTLWVPAGSVPIGLVRFAPDGERLLTLSYEGGVAVWSASGGGRLATLDGHRGTIVRGQFSPDGAQVLSIGDAETRARLWDVALETRTPEAVARVARCDSGWLVVNGRLVPGRDADCN
jgi:WD40 repeat protein/tRNA A-37 threonylcarbamoyl transferase component Bud32